MAGTLRNRYNVESSVHMDNGEGLGQVTGGLRVDVKNFLLNIPNVWEAITLKMHMYLRAYNTHPLPSLLP